MKKFLQTTPKFELCDVKYEHFGYTIIDGNRSLVILDSDFILKQSTLKLSMKQIKYCQTNDDCHFVDCQGICRNDTCQMDANDNDLKRICRNIFFMGKMFNIFEFGLFATANTFGTENSVLNLSLNKLYKLCFEDNFDNSPMIRKIIKIEQILINLVNNEKYFL